MLVNTGYKSGSTTNALDGWKEAAKSALSSGTSFSAFTVVEDKENGSVRAEYVLKSWNDFETYASKSKDHGNNGAERTGPAEIVKIRPIDGFIGREGRSKL